MVDYDHDMGHHGGEREFTGIARNSLVEKGDDGPRDFPRSGIVGQVDILEDQIQKTNAIFTELQMRIDPILAPHQEDGAVDRNSDSEKSIRRESDLVETIRRMDNQVRVLQHRIAVTIERLQL